VTRVPGVPSHLAIDPAKTFLYVVDTGGARIIRVDLRTGTEGEQIPTDDAQLPTVTRVDGAAISEIVPAGTLERPSGIALNGKTMIVTDNATSRIHLFDLDGRNLQSLETGLPPGTLAGVAVGPEGKVYFVDLQKGAIRRVDPIGDTPDSG
jgi:sugar lactone lactonase YvrE